MPFNYNKEITYQKAERLVLLTPSANNDPTKFSIPRIIYDIYVDVTIPNFVSITTFPLIVCLYCMCENCACVIVLTKGQIISPKLTFPYRLIINYSNDTN